MRFIRKHCLALGILLLSAVKILMASNLPLLAFTDAAHDDALMVNAAATILSQDWLGPYSEMTLVKGPFFPLFLAASKALSLPYLLSVTLFYASACALFVLGIKSVFKNNIFLLILFAFLLWNPISFSAQTFQRVYRFSVMPGLALLVFGGFFGAYFRREEPARKLLPWLAAGGLGLAALWLTREDGVWVLPFAAVCVAVTAGSLLARYVKTGQKRYLLNAVMSALPAAVFALGLLAVSLINYSHYGIFTVNELNGSNFAKAMRSIYAVRPAEDIAFVSVPRSTLDRIYEVSPTMESIRPNLDLQMYNWEENGKTPGDGEVEDGWFFWCFREAVALSGYYGDAAAANQFYLDVHREIEQAFSQGRLERRATLPSALMSPWREGYGKRLLPETLAAVGYAAGYEGTGAKFAYFDSAYNEALDLFEFITRGNILYEGSEAGDRYAPGLNRLVGACNAVADVYHKAGKPLFYLGLAAYAAITVLAALRKKRRAREAADVWLIATATLLSVLVLAAGVAYTHISAFYAVKSSYLAGAYPLVSAFTGIAILYCAQALLGSLKERRTKHGQPV